MPGVKLTEVEDHREFLSQAKVCMARGDHQSALELYNRALQLQPKNLPALMGKVRALIASFQFHDAEKALAKARKLQPDHTQILLLWATAALKAGKYQSAALRFNRVLRLQPESLPALMGKARAQIASSSFKSAEKTLVAALKLEPTHAQLLNLSATAALKAGDYASAIARYNKVLATEENSAARYNLASIHFRTSSPKLCIDIIDGIKEERPLNTKESLLLAKSYYRIGEIDKYNQIIDEIITHDVGEIDVSEAISQVDAALFALRVQSAEYLSARAFQHFPESERVAELRLECLVFSQNQSLAEEFFNAQWDPNQCPARPGLTMAKAWLAWGHPELALDLLEKTIERSPENLDLLIFLFTLYTNTHGYEDDAKRLGQKIYELDERASAPTLAKQKHQRLLQTLPGFDTLAETPDQDWRLAVAKSRMSAALETAPQGVLQRPDQHTNPLFQEHADPKAAQLYLRASKELMAGSREWLCRYRCTHDNINLAWQFADKANLNFETWLDKGIWAASIEHFVRLAYTNDPKTIEEIKAWIDWVGIEPLLELSDAGQPFVLVISHFGHRAILSDLLRNLPNLYQLRSGDRHPEGHPVLHPFILTQGDSNKTFREVLKVFKAGGSIIASNDQPPALSQGSTSKAICSAPLFGFDRDFGTMLPRLIYRKNLPVFWVHTPYRKGRFLIEAVRMSDPDPTENEEAWTSRWTREYASHLETVMSGAPDEHNTLVGVWNGVGTLRPEMRL